jgi:hypothetical protein
LLIKQGSKENIMFFDEDMANTGAADAPVSDDGAMTDGATEAPADENAGGEATNS